MAAYHNRTLNSYDAQHEIFYFQQEPILNQSAAMDRDLGRSNNSHNSSTSTNSTWNDMTYTGSYRSYSPMSSWNEVSAVSPTIKWEDTFDEAAYSPDSQEFPAPDYPPSSYTETTMDSRPTATSLGWTSNSKLLELYKFVVSKGRDPYFQLLDGCKPTPDTPYRVYLDMPLNSKKGAYPCQYPWGCSGKQTVFTRPADLERHYKNVHASPDQKDSFKCDYPKCSRANDPFTRKDHYRDHLRDFHKEDLGCAKGEKKSDRRDWATAQKAWLAERKISSRWWRCARCLVRRQVKDDRWECPKCNQPCETDRMEARVKQHCRQPASMAESDAGVDVATEAVTYLPIHSAPRAIASTSTEPTFYDCITCREYPGWVDVYGQWQPCPHCTPRAEMSRYTTGY